MDEDKKKWKRGVNVTVSPEAHRKLRAEAFARGISIRELLDVLVEEFITK